MQNINMCPYIRWGHDFMCKNFNMISCGSHIKRKIKTKRNKYISKVNEAKGFSNIFAIKQGNSKHALIRISVVQLSHRIEVHNIFI